MSLTLTLSREEFAAKRRAQQTDIEEALHRHVERAVDLRQNTDGWRELLNVAETLYREVYRSEAGEAPIRYPREWRSRMLETLRKTTAPRTEATVERIKVWLATNIISAATIQAATDDPEELALEWVTMHDSDVRRTHRHTDGQVRPIGVPFDVDGVEMDAPGDTSAPPDRWMNCRCTVRPTLFEEALVASISEKSWDGSASRFTEEQWKASCIVHDCDGMEKSCHHFPIKEPGGALSRAGVHAAAGRLTNANLSDEQRASAKRALRGAYKQLGEEPPESITAAGAPSDTSVVIVALPASDDPIRAIENNVEGGLHATILFFGDMDDPAPIQAAVEEMLTGWQPPPFSQQVVGQMEPLGHDDPQAQVLMLDGNGTDSEFTLGNIRATLLANEDVKAAFDSIEQYPDYTPHVTLGYGDLPSETITAAEELAEVRFDRLAVWHGDEQTEYPLGGGMTEQTDEKPVVEAPVEETNAVPWHGVLAPEGIASGDGRRFTAGSLSHRDLPLPLTWQKISDDGHKGNVTVAKIEKVEMRDGLMRASGHFLSIPEADEVVGLIGEFGKFGVSVDADDATFEVNDEEEMVDFTAARVSSACIVSIPAFAEAFVALGEWDDEDATPPVEEEVPAEVDTDHVAPEDDESLAASITQMREKMEAAKTEDGPGWLTHPVDTDRLRDYWVRGPGAAKIAWGTPGDFNRCRVNVAEYVKPQHLNGYCANRHYDALGYWPGSHHSAEGERFAAEAMGVEESESEALALVASGGWCAPSDWFTNPGLTEPTPLTVTDEGRVFGHLAQWGTCHIGFQDQCVTPPHSAAAYAYFLTGEVATDDGNRVPVGQITVGGGHANPRLGLKPTLAHYDSTSAAVCDVTLGEDEHGIWFSGWVRPGVDDDMVTALRASTLSGDWRKVGGGLELVAALAVNVPGFPIPRAKVAASGEGQISLVAAGVIQPSEETGDAPVNVEALAAAVIAALDAREARKSRMAALAAQIERSN